MHIFAVFTFNPYFPQNGWDQIHSIHLSLADAQSELKDFRYRGGIDDFYMDYKILDLKNRKVVDRNPKFDDGDSSFTPCKSNESLNYFYETGTGRSHASFEATSLKEMLTKIKFMTQSLDTNAFYKEVRNIKRFYGKTKLESHNVDISSRKYISLYKKDRIPAYLVNIIQWLKDFEKLEIGPYKFKTIKLDKGKRIEIQK